MSIFKETFPTFLQNQLKVRQEVIASGAGRTETDDGHEFQFGGETRSNEFFTYSTNKQCVVRLTSGVDVIDENVFSEAMGVGGLPAFNFQLHGGVRIPAGATQVRSDGTYEDVFFREGFVEEYTNYDFGANSAGQVTDDNPSEETTLGPKGFSPAYGDMSIRADSADGYGIVPMPGITKVNVRTKSAYGSLREAKVEFVCHNRRQLESLEILYMRPGYTLILEWGWNPFIDNEGEMSNWNYLENLFSSNRKINQVEREIKAQKEATGGNYDGLIGYCKNFTYKLRADGGYNCTTEIIAKGEVLTGIKGAGKEEIKVDGEGAIFVRPRLEEVLLEMATLSDGAVTNNTGAEKLAKTAASSLAQMLELPADVKDPTVTAPDGSLNLEVDPDRVGEDKLKPWIIADGPAGWQFSEFIGIEQGDGGHTERDGKAFNGLDNKTSTTWVRWDALCHIMNREVIPHDAQDEEIVQLQTNYIQNEYEDEVTIAPLQYCDLIPYNLAKWLPRITSPEDKIFGFEEQETRRIDWTLTDVSCNSEICMFPHTMYSHVFANKSAFHTDDLFRPLAARLASTVTTDKTITNAVNLQVRNISTFKVPGDTPQARYRTAQYSIGGIYFGVEWLLSLLKDHFYDEQGTLREDATLFEYIEKIWDSVNKICGGNHDFTVTTDNKPQGRIVRVIDMNTDELNFMRDEIFELKIQSLDSVVRDVAYNSTIPSSLASTIAIAAQAPDSIDALDQVSFAALNKGIKDRFSSDYSLVGDELLFGENNEDKEEVLAKWDKEFDKNLSRVWNALHTRAGLDDKIDTVMENVQVGDVAAVSVAGGSVVLGALGVISGGTALLVFGAAVGIWTWLRGDTFEKIDKEQWGGLLRQLVYWDYNKLENVYLTTSGITDLNQVDQEDVGKYRSALKELHKAIDYFGKVYGSTDPGGRYYKGQPYKGASNSVSSVVPLKFNAKLDGISGLVIGNVFKLPKDRLPLAYNGDDIYFIVMGEEQNITAQNDWTTTLTGHLILLGQSNRNTQSYRDWFESWDNADTTIDTNNLKEFYNKSNTRSFTKGAGGPGGDYSFNNVAGSYQDPDQPEGNLASPLPPGKKLTVNSRFGLRDLDKDGDYTPHRGVDLAASSGTPLIAVFDGEVVSTTGFTGGPSGGLVTLKLNTDKMSNIAGKVKPNRAVYCHCSAIKVTVGQKVKKGDTIALSGGGANDPGRGRSTGAHLHFGLFVGSTAIPPMPWLPDTYGIALNERDGVIPKSEFPRT